MESSNAEYGPGQVEVNTGPADATTAADTRESMLLAAPTVNGPKRIHPYTFAPTHVHWGLDNRTVLARHMEHC